MKTKSIISALNFVICYLFPIIINAQKLPNKQEISLLAPDNITVDGKSTEFTNHFLAYNDATQLYYTISNNREFIYVVIQAVDPSAIAKIMNGSITLTIGKTKDDLNAVKLTYPVFDKGSRFYYIKAKSPNQYKDLSDLERNKDSLMRLNNQRYHAKEKSIRLKGFTGLDTLISIYNDEKVKAEGAFDKSLAYTCEFSFPIRYLPAVVRQSGICLYNIKINQVEQHGITINRDPTTGKITSAYLSADSHVEQYATDFSSEYKFVK